MSGGEEEIEIEEVIEARGAGGTFVNANVDLIAEILTRAGL